MNPVRRKIVEIIRSDPPRSFHYLDAPCGQGELLQDLLEYFPEATGSALDLMEMKPHGNFPKIQFFYKDLSQPLGRIGNYDFVISVSGVMEFENTAQFIDGLHDNLKNDGTLILTNDSVQTLRDRLKFLFLGKYSRYALYLMPGFNTYKAISIQEIHKLVNERGFKIERIEHVVLYKEDWIWLPLAIPFWIIARIYAHIAKSPMALSERKKLFSLKSFIARHYIVVAKKTVRA